MMPVPVAMVRVAVLSIVAVCSTVYLEDDGAECDKEANTHTAQKHQCCLLGLVCDREREREGEFKKHFKLTVNI